MNSNSALLLGVLMCSVTLSTSTPRWFGFWDNNVTETAPFTNLQTSADVSVLERGASLGVKGMLSLYDVLFERGPSRLELRPDLVSGQVRTVCIGSGVHVCAPVVFPLTFGSVSCAQHQRLANASSSLRDLLQRGTIIGVFLGDELVWNCLRPSDLVTAANAVREVLPRGTVSHREPRR